MDGEFALKKKNSIYRILFYILFIGCILFSSNFILSFQSENPVKNDEIQKIKEEIEILRSKVSQLETSIKNTNKNIEYQQQFYSNTLTRITWEFQILMGLIVVLGVVITVFTIRIVRHYASESINKRISELSEEKIKAIVKDKTEKVINDYDKKMALLLRRYTNAVEKAEIGVK